MDIQNQQWILKHRPNGNIRDSDLTLEVHPVPTPAAGEVLVCNQWLSLDPTNRVWMSDIDQYMPPVDIGAPMRGLVAGKVVASTTPKFSVGAQVMGLGSWGNFSCSTADGWSLLPEIHGISQEDVFGHLGMIGPTAYFGLMDIGAPKIGETLVVSGAAGAVGSIAGQLGKALGCTVVGIAGGSEKCNWLVNELGLDHAIDYKQDDVGKQLNTLCPDGIDIYFDNVGGQTLDTVMARMNLYGRIIECGMISTYNDKTPAPGPSSYPRIIMKRLKVQGFIILDYQARIAEAVRALARLHLEGRMKWRSHVVDGLEQAVEAVRMLYTGANHGKLIVRIVSG